MRKNCTTCKHDHLKTPICDECYHTSDAPTKWEPATYYEPDTNADRIRAMSDEELAKWIDWLFGRCEWCDTDKIATDDCNDVECTSCILEWLKQPAETHTENADRCVCCGEIIPEGRQVCPNCVAVQEDKRMPYLIDRNSLIDRLKKCQAETTGITRATILQIIDIVKDMPNRGVNDG